MLIRSDYVVSITPRAECGVFEMCYCDWPGVRQSDIMLSAVPDIRPGTALDKLSSFLMNG